MVNEHLVNGNVVTEYTIGANANDKEDETMYRSHVLVCGGTGCTSSGSEQIIEKPRGGDCQPAALSNEVKVVRTGCFGLCALGPDHDRLSRGQLSTAWSRRRMFRRSWSEHLLKGRIVKRLLYDETVDGGQHRQDP